MSRSASTETQRRRGVLSDVMRVGLLLLDSEGTPVFANRLAHDLLGCDAAGLAAGWARVRGQLDLTFDGDGDAEWRLVGPPTTAQSLQLEVIPLRGQQLAGAAVLLKDGAADEVLSAELLLASRMRAQTYLFNALLHDLRAPLHALEINLELLGDDCLQMRGTGQLPQLGSQAGAGLSGPLAGTAPGTVPRRQSDQIVTVLKEELARLNRALRMVLDHGAPQPPTLSDVDLAALLRELAVLLRPQARRQRVTLDLQLAQSTLLVHGQRDQIRQALLNLAINGLEAMPEGGVLTLALRSGGGQARVTVSDTGPGIPEALLERVQRVYFTTKPSGTGMGLFVTRLVASGHGGRLEIGNRREGGAEVTLALPVATLHAAVG